jgi:hypothetical protein
MNSVFSSSSLVSRLTTQKERSKEKNETREEEQEK